MQNKTAHHLTIHHLSSTDILCTIDALWSLQKQSFLLPVVTYMTCWCTQVRWCWLIDVAGIWCVFTCSDIHDVLMYTGTLMLVDWRCRVLMCFYLWWHTWRVDVHRYAGVGWLTLQGFDVFLPVVTYMTCWCTQVRWCWLIDVAGFWCVFTCSDVHDVLMYTGTLVLVDWRCRVLMCFYLWWHTWRVYVHRYADVGWLTLQGFDVFLPVVTYMTCWCTQVRWCWLIDIAGFWCVFTCSDIHDVFMYTGTLVLVDWRCRVLRECRRAREMKHCKL